MERKMAVIKRIDEITPIPDADAIECARVGGWRIVVKKGEFLVNDLVVMCEIDSWIPTTVAPFLTRAGKFPKEYQGVQGERLRTVKLRGQLSQGLVLPLSVLTSAAKEHWLSPDMFEGADVTEHLGILKYEIPEYAGSCLEAKGNFPGFLKKSDQERCQNIKRELQEHNGDSFEVTVKRDGCFLYSTRLKTWSGETVKIGDIVSKGEDPVLIGVDSSGKCVPTKIISRFNNSTKTEWVDLMFDSPQKSMCVGKSGKLRLTTNHKVFRNDFSEVSAEDLIAGDKILFNVDAPSESVIHYIKSSLLGDGSLCGKYGKSNRFSEGHKTGANVHQFVRSCLGDCFSGGREVTSGYGSLITQSVSKHFVALDDLREEWYKVKGKTNLPTSLEWMDDFSVAKWYCDDGSLQHSDLQNDRATFSTNGFTKPEVERLSQKLIEMYGVDAVLYNSKGWGIRVNYSSGTINKMWSRIAPHVPECFRYKLPIEFRDTPYLEYPLGEIIQGFVEITVKAVAPVEFCKSNFPSGSVGFDIETDVHNYFCGGILVHNSSCTIYVKDDADGVCSRNIELKDVEGNAFWDIAKANNIHTKLRLTGRNLAAQGELLAPNIQGGYERVNKPEWHCFNIWDIDKQEYLLPKERRKICADVGLPHIAVVDEDFVLDHSCDELLKIAEGDGINPGVQREGLVFKSNTSQFSFKAVSNSYLIKKDKKD